MNVNDPNFMNALCEALRGCKMEKEGTLGVGSLGLLKISWSMSCLSSLVGLTPKFIWIGKERCK